MKKGLVSIIIPCYNSSKYLDDCLSALINQSYKNLEVIIVNDGSTDNSKRIIESYFDKFNNNRIILKLINQNNQGVASAVNNGLKYATGEYLMWQDSDDWYEYDAVESLVNYLNEKNLNVARGEVAVRNNETIQKIEYIGRSNSPKDCNIFKKYLYEYDSYCFSGIFICRMKHFDKCIPGRNIYTSRGGQNWQLILPITYKQKCGYLNKVVYNYRVLKDSHSHSVVRKKDLLERYNTHEDILLHVINGIEINKEEKNKYIHDIKLKYIKKKIKILLSNKIIKKMIKVIKNDKKNHKKNTRI